MGSVELSASGGPRKFCAISHVVISCCLETVHYDMHDLQHVRMVVLGVLLLHHIDLGISCYFWS